MLLTPFWGTTEKIAEIEFTQGHIQMHSIAVFETVRSYQLKKNAVIPEMVKSFIVAGGPQKSKLWSPLRLIAYI